MRALPLPTLCAVICLAVTGTVSPGVHAAPPPAETAASHQAGDPAAAPDRMHRRKEGDWSRRDRGEPTPVPAGVQVPTWSQLTPAQQSGLAPLEKQWDTMAASRRVRALEGLERRARWEAMTPEQRERLREGARNFRDMPPELREKMRTSMQAMRALPEAERKALFALWRSLDPEQRRTWLEAGGPGISPPPASVTPAR
ncbi:DUF3106 domain-containing protein [Arenimonas sp. MALMAid1274]|uniref:DUF3106 domain-containing protein n=1 Tax=Arenimonas sp. MALMAid1274 TaxID=3411630 RepID=UPI003B9EB3DB